MIRLAFIAAVTASAVVALRVEFRLLTDAINGWGRPW